MNPTALEYFVRIAQSGSISRTAIEVGIEQSTMTRHIARLESDLKVRLFHRSGRGVVLTDAGALLLTRGRRP
jgi:DNA-binding transcriptional LysR family regulator